MLVQLQWNTPFLCCQLERHIYLYFLGFDVEVIIICSWLVLLVNLFMLMFHTTTNISINILFHSTWLIFGTILSLSSLLIFYISSRSSFLLIVFTVRSLRCTQCITIFMPTICMTHERSDYMQPQNRAMSSTLLDLA